MNSSLFTNHTCYKTLFTKKILRFITLLKTHRAKAITEILFIESSFFINRKNLFLTGIARSHLTFGTKFNVNGSIGKFWTFCTP